MAANPKESQQSVSFPLDLGINSVKPATLVQPPELVASKNTRLNSTLGVPVKAPEITTVGSSLGTSVPCGGIVPHGTVDSTICFFHPSTGPRRLTTDKSLAWSPLNTYWPAQVSRAGVLPAGLCHVTPSVAYDSSTGYTWIASVRDYSSNKIGLFLSAMSDTGAVIVPPTLIDTATSLTGTIFSFVGLTTHGSNGVVVWYRDPVSDGTMAKTINYCKCTLSTDLILTVGTPTSFYTPVNNLAGQTYVVSDNNTYAYLACTDSTTNTTVKLFKFDIATMSTYSITETSMTSATGTLSLFLDSTLGYLILSVADGASGTNLVCYSPVSLIQTWAPVTIATTSYSVSSTLHVQSGTSYLVCAIYTNAASISTPTAGGTKIYYRSLVDGSAVSNFSLPFYCPATQLTRLRLSDTEQYPVFIGQRLYSPTDTVTGEGYLSDPSIEVIQLSRLGTPSVVGRFGVDTAWRLSHYTPIQAIQQSNLVYYQNNKLFFTYLENADQYIADGFVPRYVAMDFAAHQPSIIYTPEGAALISAALPAKWDGVEITEILPLSRPKIHVYTSGGSATALTSGAGGRYRFAVVQQWRDNSGVLHRSMPSEVFEITGVGMQPKITVTQPISYRDGEQQQTIQTLVYASDEQGTVLYAQDEATVNTAAVSTHFITYSYVAQPVIDAGHPPIYTDGDPSMPLPAQHPPASAGMCIVGNRCWLISAEKPYQVWTSKTREMYGTGPVGFEWSSDLIQEFPAAAGSVLAVSEWQGQPIFFSTTGIWTIPGDGPDNLGTGQLFGQPVQIGILPCTDKTITKTAAGIIYRSNSNLVLYNGQSQVMPQIDADTLGTLTGSYTLSDTAEAVLLGTDKTLVYNYGMNRCTEWAHLPTGITHVALNHATNNTIVYTPTTSQLYSVDPDTVSTTAQMQWTTGDILLGGPHDDNVISEVLFHAQYLGAHGITIEITPDYSGSTVTKTFSTAEVLAATVNGQYTLSCIMPTHSCRTIKLSITETNSSGEGTQPLSVTIIFAKNPGTKRDAIKVSGRK